MKEVDRVPSKVFKCLTDIEFENGSFQKEYEEKGLTVGTNENIFYCSLHKNSGDEEIKSIHLKNALKVTNNKNKRCDPV